MGAEGGARELLDQEVLLHRQPRRREDADRLRAVPLLHLPQALSGDLERVLPGRLAELTVLAADERLGQAVRMVDEVEREPALDAEVALVRDVARVGGDLDDPVRLGVDVEVDLAADAAERARRLDLLQRLLAAGRRALLELLVDRARRADRQAAAAELAHGVEPGAIPRRDDASLAAAALERERRALHHLLRVPDAAVAEDAGVGVVAHQPVAVVVR